MEYPMCDKVIAIISSNDEGKCRTGLAYAMNALKNEWLADVRIFIFWPGRNVDYQACGNAVYRERVPVNGRQGRCL